MRSVAASIAALSLAASGQAALAAPDLLVRVNVFSADGADPRRVSPNADAGLYAPVGMVRTTEAVPYRDGRSAKTTGTGFPVSPCLFLTNYHGVFGGAGAVAFPPPTVTVSIWNRDGLAVSSQATPLAWGDPATAGRDDWALLRLDQCLGGRQDIGWFELEPEPEPELFARNLTTAGYADDLKSRFVQQGCRIYAVSLDDKALNDCANRGGASGSPLFYMRGGIGVAVALQRGELNRTDPVLLAYSHEYANTAVLVERILARDDVRRMLREDLAAFGLNNPLLSVPLPTETTATAPEG